MLNVLDEMGYKTPTPIQEKVFAKTMSGSDVCGIAQTGTGKTLAYLLPTLRQWKFSKDKNPQILILVPTRELVVQVVETVQQFSKYLSLDVVGVYGGTNINTQRIEVQKGVDVLVATPGRLYDLALNGAFKTRDIKRLVIDEVDEMLNLGFRTQLKNILDLLPVRRQNLLFSATLTDEVEELMNTYFNAPVKVEAAPTGTPLENIQQAAYEVPNYNTKINLLDYLLSSDETMNKVLVFTASKQLADQLYQSIEEKYGEVSNVIHSNKEQNHRFRTVEFFKDGTYRFIIATDIVARGIDVSSVSHVVNFDMPAVAENYMHRIGRTGRADQDGIAINFITPKDITNVEQIEALMKLKIPRIALPADVVISDVLTEDEIPKVYMKEIQLKIPKKENVGASFHEKSAKNKKVNFTMSRKDRMMQKYGKPKTRGQKK